MSLIDSLVGTAAERPDKKRILPRRRPLFQRPRDVIELFIALGPEASMQSILQSVEIKQAEPRTLTQVVLNRSITEAELEALPTPYHPHVHLRELLLTREFRASLFHRICEAYPERPRFLFIRIPRCAGQHFATMADARHPLYPNDLATFRRGDAVTFIPALGAYARRLINTRTLLAMQPSLAPFTQNNHTPPPATFADTGFATPTPAPLRRPGDRLFTILRPPTDLLLSQVNSIMDALLLPPNSDTPDTAAIRARLPSSPATADAPGRTHLARAILRALTIRNPICHALADGTAAAALRAARYHDIELADLSGYEDWTKYTWDVEPNPPEGASTPHLRPTDLTPADTAPLIAEDEAFYKTFTQALSQIGDLRYSVRGRDL